MSLFVQPASKVSPSLPSQMSNRVCWRCLSASRVARLWLMVSMTWKGRLTRGISLRVPSSLYLPGQTSSVLVMSILAIYPPPLFFNNRAGFQPPSFRFNLVSEEIRGRKLEFVT